MDMWRFILVELVAMVEKLSRKGLETVDADRCKEVLDAIAAAEAAPKEGG